MMKPPKPRKKCSCSECGCDERELMKWFKHLSDGRDDSRIFDAMDEFGSDAYYAYYATSEVYADQYDKVDEEGVLTVSTGWFFSQLRIEKGSRDRYKKIFQVLTDGGMLEVTFDEHEVHISIPDFSDLASNWVKRKAREREKAGEKPPPESLRRDDRATPAVEEEVEEEVEEKKNIVGEVIDHLNKTAGTSYRKAARESVNHIKARAKEGASIADFKIVIDSKVAEWSSDAKMVKYLRPSTLFNSEKFWGYLNAAKMAKTITPKPSGGGYRGSGVAI